LAVATKVAVSDETFAVVDTVGAVVSAAGVEDGGGVLPEPGVCGDEPESSPPPQAANSIAAVTTAAR
jgi:hypothetical protein